MPVHGEARYNFILPGFSLFCFLLSPVNVVYLLKICMMTSDLLKRITIDTEICHGKPTIRRTRHMVESVLEYLAGGDTPDDLLQEFPDLEKDDILACLAFAAKSVQFKNIEFPAA